MFLTLTDVLLIKDIDMYINGIHLKSLVNMLHLLLPDS